MSGIENYKQILKDYLSTCEYLKQICSDKANKYYRYNNYITRGTLVATIILSAIAFANRDDIFQLFFDVNDVERYSMLADLIVNIVALLVLILTVINLLCRFQEKATDYFHTVTTLSSIMRDFNSLLIVDINDDNFVTKYNELMVRYDTMLDYLPSHTDEEFVKAKYKVKLKKDISELIKTHRLSNFKKWSYRVSLGIFLGRKEKKNG